MDSLDSKRSDAMQSTPAIRRKNEFNCVRFFNMKSIDIDEKYASGNKSIKLMRVTARIDENKGSW